MNIETIPRQEFIGGIRHKRIFRDIPKTFSPELEEARAALVNRSSHFERERFISYEIAQMRTHLGERLNVSISSYDYDIRDGMLYGRDMEEPFLESIIKGRDLRLKIGNTVDFARENAEVEGFIKIQQLMSDPITPIGSMMLSISPKGRDGSTYQHNFYDVFTLKEKNGKRYVETKRFTSGLGIKDYKDKLSVFANLKTDDEDAEAFLLANPIAIANTLNANDLHKYLHKDHEFTDEKTLRIINRYCDPIARDYARCLIYEPQNFEKQRDLFNTYLNKADDIKRKTERYGEDLMDEIIPQNIYSMVLMDVETYKDKPVEVKMTGCGASGGYDDNTQRKSPFSVSEFGKKWEYHKGDCVVCKARYTKVGPCNICIDCEKKFDEEN